ncbi:hypothetical protein AB4Z21_33500, partial [Paenibacillus sp. MCAF20]
MFQDLATLSCGSYENHANCKDIFENIYKAIEVLEKRIAELPEEDDETIRLLGPFYGRSLLENICTAIIGRLDPFRILFLRNVQMQDSFGITSRSKGAIQWFGDVFEKGTEREPAKMWSSNLEISSIGRGLLGDYYGEVYWRPAFESLIDDREDYIGKPYLSSDVTGIPPRQFTTQIRQKLSGLFSSLSKGVHSELIIKTELIYDKTTVLSLISEVINQTALLALLSHRIPSSLATLDFKAAVERYASVI